jgi:hypothetical protein
MTVTKQPGRKGPKRIYPTEVYKLNVPLTLSKAEVDELLQSVAPTRSAAARTVIQRYLTALDVARCSKTADNSDRALIHESMAACLRLLVTARAKEDAAEVARLLARYNQLRAILEPTVAGLKVTV